jgi:PAS domain S-box-containing protein
VLGILDVGISLQEMDDAVSHAVRKTIVFSLLLFSGIAALLAFGLVRFVAKPVRKLTEAANRISLGEYGRRVEVSSGDELGHLADSFNRMSEGIQQRQTEVERSRNEFQILFESVPTSIAVVDRNFRIVRTNQDFKDTFGEHEGANCCSAYKGLGEACLMDCPVSQTLRDKTLHRCEEHGVTKEGEIIHYFVHTAPVLNPGGEVEYVVRASLDLRETKRLERELRASREFLDKLVENSIHGIVAVDPEGEAIIFNRSAERILGYRADEALGQRALARFFPKEFVEMLESDGRAAEEAVDGKMVARETWVRAKSGERVPVRFSGVVLREDGSAAGAVGFFQDLRRFRTLEEEKRQAERLALVGQTVVALAHEIKNILTGLDGGVYVTRTAMRSEDDLLLQKGWDMVERNIEKVSHLVKDLLGFSKLRTSERMWLNPNELAEEVGTLFEEKARQLGIELVMDLAPDMDEAFLDPRTTHMCLNNLLSNAMDACMEDRAKEHHRIVVRTRGAKEEWVTFEIRDDGKGMDEDVKKKIFAGFFTTKEAKGTGLGLMVTQQIIHEQGGRISFQTEPGQGSVFRVAFPRAQVALEKAEPVSAQVN